MQRAGHIFVTTAPRLGPVLAAELEELGYKPLSISSKGVALRGSFSDCLKLNLHLRTAYRVLWQFAEIEAKNAQELYDQARGLPWEEHLPASGYLRIDSFVSNPTIRDSRFANLRLKDAVVDRLRAVCGQRPDTGPGRHGACLFLHWAEKKAILYFDTTGESLSRRGYRLTSTPAPMQEALAAAVLRSTIWQPQQPLLNPMCGSGTIAIEAALMATRTAPGLLRDNFAFMHLHAFDRMYWNRLKVAAKAKVIRPRLTIEASDIDPQAVQAAKSNARTAGVSSLIRFKTMDFRQTKPPPPPGCIILNPEYGERLGDKEALKPVYRAIGDFFKQRCQGYTGYVFTGNRELAGHIGLRTKRKLEFYNGKIDSRLLEYELYAGRKEPEEH